MAALLHVGDRIDLVAADPQGVTARVVAADLPVLALPQPDDEALVERTAGTPGRAGRTRGGPHGTGPGGRVGVPDLHLLPLACWLSVRLGRPSGTAAEE